MQSPIIQIFGKKKCQETRKAERWFKERGMRIQSIDLTEKGLSPGEQHVHREDDERPRRARLEAAHPRGSLVRWSG
jgi:hypothetical protein